MHIHDRGDKKWKGFFIPEHLEKLQELYDKQNDVEKPLLSVDQLEEMERTMQEAMEHKQLVSISYYENKRILNIKGIIDGHRAGKLILDDGEGKQRLEMDNIVGVNLSEI